MKKIIKKAMAPICLFGVLILPGVVAAQENMKTMLKKVGTGDDGAGYAAYEGDDVFDEMAGGIVEAFLALLGVIFLILIIYGGFLWMASRDDEEQINKAKKTIQRSIVGLLILASSFMIWQFIANVLLAE